MMGGLAIPDLERFSMLTQEGQLDFDKSSEAAESRVLFGPPALLPGESLAEYWRLYSLFQDDLVRFPAGLNRVPNALKM